MRKWENNCIIVLSKVRSMCGSIGRTYGILCDSGIEYTGLLTQVKESRFCLFHRATKASLVFPFPLLRLSVSLDWFLKGCEHVLVLTSWVSKGRSCAVHFKPVLCFRLRFFNRLCECKLIHVFMLFLNLYIFYNSLSMYLFNNEQKQLLKDLFLLIRYLMQYYPLSDF